MPMLYMIMYIFVNFPSNWILDVKGIRKGVIIGSVTTALGAGIRCLVDLSFNFVLVGQVFCAIGQPFLLNAPAKIATFWFNDKHVICGANSETRGNCCLISREHRRDRNWIRTTGTHCRLVVFSFRNYAETGANIDACGVHTELYRSITCYLFV